MPYLFAMGGLILVFFAAVAGWVMNLAALMHTAADPITAAFVLRCFGVPFVFIGAVMGWL
jgi:hypothetical protein